MESRMKGILIPVNVVFVVTTFDVDTLKYLLIIPLIVAKAAITYLNIQSHFGKNMNLVNVALQYSKTIIPKNALLVF